MTDGEDTTKNTKRLLANPKMTTPTIAQLTHALTSLGLPAPHSSFLIPILTPPPGRGLPPLQALAATAKHRLLNTDITLPSILSASTPSLPHHITDPSVASRLLSHDVVVQVLAIDDTSRSRWDQIEALEMERKGETTKGREVIRVVAPGDEEPSSAATQQAPAAAAQNALAKASWGPFKLEMQDFKGGVVYGFELQKVAKIGYPPLMSVGCKVLLKQGCRVARGMVILEPGNVVVLGGKIEGLDKAWREGREKALRDAVGDGRRRDDA